MQVGAFHPLRAQEQRGRSEGAGDDLGVAEPGERAEAKEEMGEEAGADEEMGDGRAGATILEAGAPMSGSGGRSGRGAATQSEMGDRGKVAAAAAAPRRGVAYPI